MISKGINVCFGTNPQWESAPILNLPAYAEKVRRKFRHNAAGMAYIKTGAIIEEWILSPNDDGTLRLAILRAANAA